MELARNIDSRLSTAVPVRLRPATEVAIGTTAFFRNRALFHTLLEEMSKLGKEHFDIWFHACSIGAEVYSFVVSYLLGGYAKQFTLRCYAADKEQIFLDIARKGLYPKAILTGMTSDEVNYFSISNHHLQVKQKVRKHVKFLPPCDFVTDSPAGSYDVVFLLNALVYVPAGQQAATLDRLATYNRNFLVTSAFHADSIKDDLDRNGYAPVTQNIEMIHEGWTDRRIDAGQAEIRPGIYAPWSLPSFSRVADHEYKVLFNLQKTNKLTGAQG